MRLSEISPMACKEWASGLSGKISSHYFNNTVATLRQVVANVREHSGAWGERVGNLIEFLAYSGVRIKSEAHWIVWGDLDWNRKEIVVRGDPQTATKNSEIRRVPILPDMEALLLRLKGAKAFKPDEHILEVSECGIALTRACKQIGIHR